MTIFAQRVVGALSARAATFEDVEHDRTATWQAAAVVLAAAVAGQIVRASATGTAVRPVALLLALVGWVVGAWALLIVGTRLLPGRNTQADLGELLRTVGFAQAAGLVQLAGLVPYLGLLSWILSSIWVLVAMVVAVRQALDYESTNRAALVCLVTWTITTVITQFADLVGLGPGVTTVQ